MEKTNCNKCDTPLTKDNSYRFNGYLHRQCKKCRNAHVKMLYRKRARYLYQCKLKGKEPVK